MKVQPFKIPKPIAGTAGSTNRPVSHILRQTPPARRDTNKLFGGGRR